LLAPSGEVESLGRTRRHKYDYESRTKREPVPDKCRAVIKDGFTGLVATVGNLDYTLSNASFDCRGHRSVYIYDVHTNRYTRVIRNAESMTYSSKAYKPFKEGQTVIGRIIMEDGIEKFDLLVNPIDYADELSQNAECVKRLKVRKTEDYERVTVY
jgi:hypothetical protein